MIILDKRIRDVSDIYSVTDGISSRKFVKTKGYFANTIHAFSCLDTGTYYGELISHLDSDACFLTDFNNVVGGDPTCKSFRYFLPEALLKPEKEYRPLTNEEFLNLYDAGKIHSIRRVKMCLPVRYIITSIYISKENNEESVLVQFNGHDFGYSMGYLFRNDFEYFDGKEWKPFKMEK